MTVWLRANFLTATMSRQKRERSNYPLRAVLATKLSFRNENGVLAPDKMERTHLPVAVTECSYKPRTQHKEQLAEESEM